jgi:hypothetical protein
MADNESAMVTGTCQISGASIITTSLQATDPGHVNFSGAFTQAHHSQWQLREVQRDPGHRLLPHPGGPDHGLGQRAACPLNGIQMVSRSGGTI